MTERTSLGLEIEEGLPDAQAWHKGDLALQEIDLEPFPAEAIRAIRRKVASSRQDFEQKFGLSARTLEGLEQGRRKPDTATRLLLKIIDREPKAVIRALHSLS